MWTERKELKYKELCLSRGLGLRDGARELFSYAKERGMGIAIASSAPKMNMDWYIPRFRLLDFFDKSCIIAGRTDIPSKPDGAIFRLALEALGADPDRTIVFEDSLSGVRSAMDAGITMIYRMRNPGSEAMAIPGITEIASFNDLREQEG